jgi:hypothetical protein
VELEISGGPCEVILIHKDGMELRKGLGRAGAGEKGGLNSGLFFGWRDLFHASI